MPTEPTHAVEDDSPGAQIARLLTRVDALLAHNAEQTEQIRLLIARIAELEATLAANAPPKPPPKTPANSSLPPSSAHKPNSPEPPAAKKRRRGHKGVARALCPDPTHVRNIYAQACACGAHVAPEDQVAAHTYDHVELPPIKPVITRVVLHDGCCAGCGKRVAAKPPADMAPGSPFGPRLTGMVTYLHAVQMVSYSRLTTMLREVFHTTVSQGALASMMRRAGSAVAPVADALEDLVRQSPSIASDETSARVGGKTWWLWNFSTARAVYQVIAPTRGKCVPTAFLRGMVPEVWLSDRLAAQTGHGLLHQACLAHLLREAQYAIDHGDSIFAVAFKRFLRIACWLGARRSRMSDTQLAHWQGVLERERDRVLALPCAAAAGVKLRASVAVGAREKLLVFMSRRDVEPTNNASERNLRPGVIFRKVTGCFRSDWGPKLYGAIRSIVATGRLAGRGPLESITRALEGLLPTAEPAPA